MYGGYYVTLVRLDNRAVLLAGPFQTYQEADRIGPSVKPALEHSSVEIKPGFEDHWGISFFLFHRPAPGLLNAALWVKPYEGTWNAP